MRRIDLLAGGCLGLLLAQSSGLAQEPNPIEQFALDGLDVGQPFMNQSLDAVIGAFGLPDRIEIRKDDAFWDIDIRETPADWIYPGMVITAHYYQEGVTRKDDAGKAYLAPGPYSEPRQVTRIRVFDEGVNVRYGLGVGTDAQAVLERLGVPERYRPTQGAIYYHVVTESGGNISVWFQLDNPARTVQEIVWAREAWH